MKSKQSRLFAMSLLFGAVASCGGDGDDNRHHPHPHSEGVQKVTVDFSGAMGVLVIDPSERGNLRLQGFHNSSLRLQDDGTIEDTSLVKVDKDGKISSALSTPGSEENGGFQPDLPRVQTIALSPAGDIYLHFQHPFIYRAPEDPKDWDKVWDPTSGYQCQIFKVKGGTIDELRVNPPKAGDENLECIDNQRFVDTWQAQRNSVFQFDAESNVYYPGSIPDGHGKMVVYRRSRDGSSTKEVINANICVQDFLVTPNGGVFYTGTSQCENNSGGDGGFFRYVSPDSEVREIARDWWNFVFEPVSKAEGDQALFFGPDPRSASTASWNTACLFRFDPASGSTAAESIEESITCGNDIWSWIGMTRPEDLEAFDDYNPHIDGFPSDKWAAEYSRRCTSTGDVFAGGGSQINAIKQDSDGEVYVIGRVRMKKEGEVTCSLSIKGPHCLVRGIPYLSGDEDYGTQEKCDSGGGNWIVNNGYCSTGVGATPSECHAEGGGGDWFYSEAYYHGVASSLCSEPTENEDNTRFFKRLYEQIVTHEKDEPEPDALYSRSWLGCQMVSAGTNNHDWTEEYRGLAKVEDESKSLVLLSGTDEQAINIWLVNDVPYYSTYNTTLGQYLLKRYDSESQQSVIVAENFEAYNIERSNEEGKVFYDGLDFTTNAYSFGTIDEETYERTIKSGLTGTVKTIVILPEK